MMFASAETSGYDSATVFETTKDKRKCRPVSQRHFLRPFYGRDEANRKAAYLAYPRVSTSCPPFMLETMIGGFPASIRSTIMNAIAQATPVAVESLSVITYNAQPVITTELLAKVYGTEETNIRQNFNNNADRFIEGKHFIKLEGDALRDFKKSLSRSNLRSESLTGLKPVSRQTRNLTLWTERGAARHAKMLDTDQAWAVFEKLEESYFKSPRANTVPALPKELNFKDGCNLCAALYLVTPEHGHGMITALQNILVRARNEMSEANTCIGRASSHLNRWSGMQ